MTTLIEEPQEEVWQENRVNHIGKILKTSQELRMTTQIGYYDMDYIILDLASDVKIIMRQTWESMGKPRLVWSPIQLRLENQSKALPKLEEISTQNGPPKGNNKIIVKIIK